MKYLILLVAAGGIAYWQRQRIASAIATKVKSDIYQSVTSRFPSF